jgi:hypothetical protein
MVVLSHELLQVIIGLEYLFFKFLSWSNDFIWSTMDWEFSLPHLPNDVIQFYQPSISRGRVRVEAETSESRVEPRLDLDPQQLPLTRSKSLQPDTRALVFILEIDAMLIGSHQVVFKGCFQNTNEIQIVNCLFDEVGHPPSLASRPI